MTEQNVYPPPSGGKLSDWEIIFECRDNGLIALIESARSTGALKKCAHLIIRKLFTRKDDEAIRISYEKALDELLPDENVTDGGKAELEDGRNKISRLLRDIKDERKRKLEQYEAKLAEEAAAASTRREPDPDPGHSLEEIVETATMEPAEDICINRIFADALWEVINKRLDVLQNGLPKAPMKAESLPFILSKAFGARFEAILREHFIPEIAPQCRGIITRAHALSADKWPEYMRESFDDKNGRELLWRTWQKVWDDITLEKDVPEKPEEKQKSLLNILKKEKKPAAWEKKVLTIEEWNEETAKVKAANKRTRRVWCLLLENTGAYQPPNEGDGVMLKELFGKSATGLKKQIDALRQIVQQGGNVGKAFDSYQQGKNLELSLLAASYQYPDLFLSGTPSVLKAMLRGLSDSQIRTCMPLIPRYLAGYL